MQEVASDSGMQPVHSQIANPANDVGGLIAAVESKMSELMAWHAQQVKQLETDKTVLRAQVEEQEKKNKADRDENAWLRGEIDADREKLTREREMLERWRNEIHAERDGFQKWEEQLSKERIELDTLRNDLETQSAKLNRDQEKFVAQRDGFETQRQAMVTLTEKLKADQTALNQEWESVNQLREQIQSRAQAWLDSSAELLSNGLKLAQTDATQPSTQDKPDHSDDEHQHAA